MTSGIAPSAAMEENRYTSFNVVC